jgi:CSLREA domain-containing protein
MNTRINRFLFGATISLAIALLLLVSPIPTITRADVPLPFSGVDITVSTTTDESDSSGNGAGCSLREAIHAVNIGNNYGGCFRFFNQTPYDTIILPSGDYALTRTGSGEDLDIMGDLDILRSVIISGTGVPTPIVRGGASWDDRILDVVSGTVTIKQVMLTGGHAPNFGGGIFTRIGTVVMLNDSFVSSSDAVYQGGGIYNAGTMTLNHSSVSVNETLASSVSYGAGILNTGILTLSNSSITWNHALGTHAFGGGVINSGGTMNIGVLAINNSTIIGNISDVECGGVANGGISMQINGSTISGNTAVGNGGGICDPGEVTSSLISGNNAGADGGGIYNPSETTLLTNVTLSGNHANTFGGGISTGGLATLINVTIFGNTAAGAGGINLAGGSATLTNTIVANNTGGDCGGIIGGSFNLSSDNNCGFGARGNINVKLSPLGNYGGSTFTHMPLPGSPAIDFGTNTGCPSTDQRGFPRPVNGICDVGAVERQILLYLPLIER